MHGTRFEITAAGADLHLKFSGGTFTCDRVEIADVAELAGLGVWWVIGASATVNVEVNATGGNSLECAADVQNNGNLILKNGARVDMRNGGTVGDPYDSRLFNYGYLNFQGIASYLPSDFVANTTKHNILNLQGGTLEKTGAGTSVIFAGIMNEAATMTMTAGLMRVYGLVSGTPDAVRLTGVQEQGGTIPSLLNLKGGTELDVRDNHLAAFDTLITATKSGTDYVARISGTGNGGGNFYVQDTVINIGGYNGVSDGKMVLLVHDGEVHWSNSYLAVTLDFASDSCDRLECQKLVINQGTNTLAVSYKNVPQTLPNKSWVVIDAVYAGSGAFTQYLMPPNVQYEWVSEDLYVKTSSGNPPPPEEG